jgi:hypothetical protein
LPGFTLFANRVCLVPWAWENLKYILPNDDNTIEDQKASFGASWIVPQAGLEVYGELGVDDFVPGGTDGKIEGYIRYPFHTMIYTVGLKKHLTISKNKNIYGELIFEWNDMEMSQDFQFQWPSTWNSHGKIKQGYTNKGQWLGAGSGGGGNSQYLEFKVYYPKGTSSLFVHRNNPESNFVYSQAVYESANKTLEEKYFTGFKANFIVGINTRYFLFDAFSLYGGAAYNYIVNPYYFYTESGEYKGWNDVFLHNFSFQLGAKWAF